MLRINAFEIQQSNDDVSNLRSIKFNGKKNFKFFTVKNEGDLDVTVNLSLVQTTGDFAFSVTPSTFLLSPDYKISFFVEYDSDKGLGSSASLYSDVDIYGTQNDEDIVLGSTTGINFEISNDEYNAYRSLGPLFSVNSEENYIVNESESQKMDNEASFGVLKTNPKMTGNVTITVDSNESVWLNSIDAEKDLANDKYKKYAVSYNSSYAADIKKFFDSGKTSSELVFSLYEYDNQFSTNAYTSTKRNLYEQHDRFYQYGASQLSNKYYEEDFSFFAPLYLKNTVPEYFVIFRTNGPINEFTYECDESVWKDKVISDIISNSRIIKVFDMSKNSKIGKYLRTIINHPARKESEMYVSFQDEGYTTWNGISYEKGTFIESAELLYDYFQNENPLITMEEFMTLGFQRNKTISSHLLNLEFLFNDEDADLYSINRYFGFYVNAIDLADFELCGDALYQHSEENDQTPYPRKNVDGTKFSLKSFTQTNPNGIKMYVDNDTIHRIPEMDETSFSSIVEELIDEDTETFKASFNGNLMNKIEDAESISFWNDSYNASADLVSTYYDGKMSYAFLSKESYSGNLDFSEFIEQKWKAKFDVDVQNYESKIFNNDFIEKSGRFFYVKDKNNDLYTLKSTANKTVDIDEFTQNDTIELTLGNEKIDFSNFSGFGDILTQTNAVLLGKGCASMMIEIKNFFKPNDFIEISIDHTSAISGYPLRWKIVANSTGTNPGSVWQESTISSDDEGEFYLSYFNPGDDTINIDEFVLSIKSAFDLFDGKPFIVLAKDDGLYFKSTQEGLSSENMKMTYSLDEYAMDVMGVTGGTSGEVNFIGGSDKKYTRAKISKDVAEGMLSTEYISTKGSFSKIKEYDILGETIVFSPYLEEPVYDEDGEILTDFTGCDEYVVVMTENESSKIQLTSDDKITTYEIFKSTMGILSIYPLKNFDTDYYSSEYSKTYLPELIKYFSRDFDVVTVESIEECVYRFDKDFSLDFSEESVLDYPFLKIVSDGRSEPIIFNENAKFEFHSSGNEATLIFSDNADQSIFPVVGDKILLMSDEKMMYYLKSNLSSFKGFLSLSSIVTSDDESALKVKENLWDPTRFNPTISSEYERCMENYLKSLVLKSRIVPYAVKWVLNDGDDVHDNPYRLNYHRSFGKMGFSPSDNTNESDPMCYTHEWEYLDGIPDGFDLSKYGDYSFSYFHDRLDESKYDFSSTKRNWFDYYFSVGYPTEKYSKSGIEMTTKIIPFERYSKFKYDENTGKTSVFFRGYEFRIQETDSNGNDVSNSKKYDGYKFSVIMKTEQEKSYLNEERVEFRTIVNEKFEFMIVIIVLRTNDFRYSLGNVGYVDLYSLQNNSMIGNYEYFSHVNGLSEYKYPISCDEKMTSYFNLGEMDDEKFKSMSRTNLLDETLESQINVLPDGNFYDVVSVYKNSSFSSIITISPVSLIVDDDYFELQSDTIFSKNSLSDSVSEIRLPFSGISWDKYMFYYQSGGTETMSDVAKILSFSEIKKVITGTSTFATMKYEIYDEEGNLSMNENFYLTGISPMEMTRSIDLIPIADTDKPSIFYNIDTIGAVLYEKNDSQIFYRYQGNFSPKFTNVIDFCLREDEDFTVMTEKDFLFNNTHLAPEFDDFSVLKNEFFNKISDSEILSISTDSGYSPVYPMINEIAIDKKDEFVWNSTWDAKYYRKYESTSSYEDINGLSEMIETKSFLGSKMMKIPDSFDLYQYEVKSVSSEDDLNFDDDEITYIETDSSITVIVNVSNRLLREMMGTNNDFRGTYEFRLISENLPNFLSSEDIDSKAEEYLKSNVLDLYEIDEVKMYVLQTGNSNDGKIETVSDSSVSMRSTFETGTDGYTLSSSELINGGYSFKKDMKVTMDGNLKFKIEYSLDSRYYTSLSFGVSVKRI